MSFDGTWAYRFTGFSVKYNIPWHLVGVGVMTIKDDGIEGYHNASTTQMQGSGAKVIPGRYNLKGKWTKAGSDDEYEAAITFTHTENGDNGSPKQVLDATFSFIEAGDRDHLWLISKSTINTTNPTTKKEAVELVSGEAVRIKGA